MASNGKETTMASPEHGEEEQQNVLRRVASLPLVNSACDLAATAYASTKESHPYVRSICDMAEKGVTSITSVAVSSAQPVVTKLEPEVTTAEECASEVPDKVEDNLPILQQTADEVTSEAQELASSRLTDVKETMIRMVDMTKEAVQDSMKSTKSVVTDSMSTVVESRMGQLAISGMEAVLEKSEELLDHYLPMTDEELAELAESVEGAEVSSAQPQERRSYFVRLGSLSTKLRQRAYRYSLNKMRHTSQSIREALSQLHQTMGLIEYLKQGVTLQEVQEKFHHIWVSWNRKQTKGSEIKDLAKPELVPVLPIVPGEMECLNMASEGILLWCILGSEREARLGLGTGQHLGMLFWKNNHSCVLGQSHESDGEKAGPSQTSSSAHASKPGLSVAAHALSSHPESGSNKVNIRHGSQDDEISILDFSDLKGEHEGSIIPVFGLEDREKSEDTACNRFAARPSHCDVPTGKSNLKEGDDPPAVAPGGQASPSHQAQEEMTKFQFTESERVTSATSKRVLEFLETSHREDSEAIQSMETQLRGMGVASAIIHKQLEAIVNLLSQPPRPVPAQPDSSFSATPCVEKVDASTYTGDNCM
nr:perilipin-3-like [Chrysemys picta bellii]